MPTIQIRNIPEDLYLRLVESARASRRSLTQQAIVLFKKALDDKNIDDTEQKLQTLEELRSHIHYSEYDEDQVVEWIREDRDN